MATTREIDYKGRHIKITAAKNGPHFVGTFRIEGDPVITDSGPDAMTESAALDSAERTAKERVDLIR